MTPLPAGTPLMLSCLLSLVQALADLTRLVQLIFLLLPVACWAPLALHYGCRRQQWAQHLRYTAQHDSQDHQGSVCLPYWLSFLGLHTRFLKTGMPLVLRLQLLLHMHNSLLLASTFCCCYWQTPLL